MSNRICCPHCFAFTLFESTAPKICGYCGKFFNEAFANTTQNKSINKKPINKPIPIKLEEEHDDNDVITNIPNIDKIEIEINEDLRSNRQKLGSLMGTKQGNPEPLSASILNKGKKGKTLNKKQLEQVWAENFPKTNREIPSEIGENNK